MVTVVGLGSRTLGLASKAVGAEARIPGTIPPIGGSILLQLSPGWTSTGLFFLLNFYYLFSFGCWLYLALNVSPSLCIFFLSLPYLCVPLFSLILRLTLLVFIVDHININIGYQWRGVLYFTSCRHTVLILKKQNTMIICLTGQKLEKIITLFSTDLLYLQTLHLLIPLHSIYEPE